MRLSLAAAAMAAAIACSGAPAPTATKPPPAPVDRAAATPEPRRTAELDALFGEALARWVVVLNQPQAAVSPGTFRADAAQKLPAAVSEALAAALDAARAARDASEAEVDAASDRLDDAVAELDRRLAAADLGYVIDAAVVSSDGDRSVLLFSFAVDRLRRYKSDAAAYRALWVKRLDPLAYRYRLVGLAAQRRDALILTAQIDEWLVREILPALSSPEIWSGPLELPDELETAVSTALSRELAAVAGAGLTELAAALDERRRLFDELAERLGSRGVTVERPATLALDAAWRAALESGLTAAERDRLDAVEKRLAVLEVKIAYTRVRELAIAAVEHHEIQHQIDNAVRPSSDGGVELVAARERSAYLAQIARQPASAMLSLAKLAGFAVSPMSPPLERRVARAIIGDLSRQVGGAASAESTEELAVASIALLGRDSAELSAAAAALWKRDNRADLAALALE